MNAFTSGLAAHIESLLALKHAMGLPYLASERHLRGFDAMCSKDHPGQDILTREMALAWAVGRPDEHVNTQTRRITPVRQLAKHMIRVGVEAYLIAPGIPGPRIRYRPHLFTHQQLRAVFDAADSVPLTPYGRSRHLIIPVIFRMIYCLGLRPGEARRLRRNDVDLIRGTVFIRESKGHKDRRVFMSADLCDYCRDYDHTIAAHHPNRVPFFPNHTGGFYSPSILSVWFHELLSADPLLAAVTRHDSPPRPYDLRHAHVIEVINRCTLAGRDPEAFVAYLSMHLGHTNLDDTWYYFHLAPQFHPDLREIANTGIESILPEADHGTQ